MKFLSIKDETCEALRLLRHEGETDDALIKRILELARCYMVLFGMENVDGGPKIEGDLYSSCPECGAIDTKYLGTEAMDPKYKCKKCGNVFFPHMKFFTDTKLELSQ